MRENYSKSFKEAVAVFKHARMYVMYKEVSLFSNFSLCFQIAKLPCFVNCFLFRYDAVLKQLKHMKPIPLELLESFDEGLDFLGRILFILYFSFYLEVLVFDDNMLIVIGVKVVSGLCHMQLRTRALSFCSLLYSSSVSFSLDLCLLPVFLFRPFCYPIP